MSREAAPEPFMDTTGGPAEGSMSIEGVMTPGEEGISGDIAGAGAGVAEGVGVGAGGVGAGDMTGDGMRLCAGVGAGMGDIEGDWARHKGRRVRRSMGTADGAIAAQDKFLERELGGMGEKMCVG
uniref:Uncharacterized protein n=1 Tax=Kalanchoe fedtschenkoi TaxID=63787 RepID=A0A7N0VKN0_KALFE